MKLILKQKDGFTRNVAQIQPDFLEILTKNGVKIYQKSDVLFDKTFENGNPSTLFVNKDKVIVGDFPIIRHFDLMLSEETVYSSEIISSAFFCQMCQDNQLLLTHAEDGYIPKAPLTLCVLENGNVQKQWETSPIPVRQVRIFSKNGYIFVPNYDLNLITTLNDNNGEILWQFDISRYGTYYDEVRFMEFKRKIQEIYYHNDKVIVTFSRGITALQPQTGEVLWKILFDDRDPRKLIFNDNIAYSGSGLSYTVINLEQGKIFYKNDYLVKKTAIIAEKERWLSYQLFSLRKGFLWSYMQNNGWQFLTKLEPSTGEVVDSCVLPIGLSQDPVFIENTIYMRDMDGNLNIFELEE